MSRTTPLRWALLAGLIALPASHSSDASAERPAAAQKEKDDDKKKSNKKKDDSKKKKKKDDSKKKKKDDGKKKNNDDGKKKNGDDGKKKNGDDGKKKNGDDKKNGDKPKDDGGQKGQGNAGENPGKRGNNNAGNNNQGGGNNNAGNNNQGGGNNNAGNNNQGGGNNNAGNNNAGNNRPGANQPRQAPNPGPRVQATHKRPSLAAKPKAAKRSWDPRVKAATPLHRTRDHRYARPRSYRLTQHPQAHHAPPRFTPYRAWYSHWWIHPFFRWQHATIRAVQFPFAVTAWVVDWTPDPRPGWTWVAGRHVGPVWHPGHWRPAHTRAVVYSSISYIYVAGYWSGDTYLEGYYRPEERTDGDWAWVEGYYLEDGVYVAGHWVPSGTPPEGMTWEAGFFDGEEWVEGFWRPGQRSGHRWISSYYDDEGVYHSGYWEPIQAQAGAIWVPGWFDGNTWQEGYWVPTEEYESADLTAWEPEPGFDSGWSEDPEPVSEDTMPLAVPVTFLDEDFED